MTTGEWLSSLSTVENASALDHLINIDGSGGVSFVPAMMIDADMSQMTLSANFSDYIVSADTIISSIEAIMTESVYSADVSQNILESNLCQ